MYDTAALKASILDRDAAFNQAVAGILPNNGTNFKFLLYAIWHVRPDVLKLRRGVRQKNLSLEKKIKAISVPYPPLPEQRRIVAILDEAFAAITTARKNAEQNLQNARAVFESYLNAVFTQRGEGWTIKMVCEIAQHSLGKMLDKNKNKGNPQPYLRNINVRWFNFDLSDMREMRFLDDEAGKFTAIKGDLLICEGGYPGRAAIWSEDYPIHFQKAIHRVRFHESERSKWFLYYLYMLDASGNLKQYFTGTGIQHFTGESLAKLEVPLPPLREQGGLLGGIERLSSETQRLESLYQRKLAALDELKKSLLHQAFTGQLTGKAGLNGLA